MNDANITPIPVSTEAVKSNVGQSSQSVETAQALAALLPQFTGLVSAATMPSGPQHKPGYATTEFWLCALVVAGNVWGACSGLVKPETATLVTGILSAVYTVARSLVKSSAASPVTLPLAAGLAPAASPLSSGLNGAQGDPATGYSSPFETKAPEGTPAK